MADFPGQFVMPEGPTFGTWGPTSLFGDVTRLSGSVVATATGWVAASMSVFVPVWIEQRTLAQAVGVYIGTQSGNVDIGLFDEQKTKLISTGSTAVGAAGVQAIDITDTQVGPGTVWIGVSCDNTTAKFYGFAAPIQPGTFCGIQQQASTFPLSATPTMVNLTASTLVPYVIVQCGASTL